MARKKDVEIKDEVPINATDIVEVELCEKYTGCSSIIMGTNLIQFTDNKSIVTSLVAKKLKENGFVK